MGHFIKKNFLIGPEEFQSILNDMQFRNSSALLNMVGQKSSQLKMLTKRRKYSYRKSMIEQMASRRERLNSIYFG